MKSHARQYSSAMLSRHSQTVDPGKNECLVPETLSELPPIEHTRDPDHPTEPEHALVWRSRQLACYHWVQRYPSPIQPSWTISARRLKSFDNCGQAGVQTRVHSIDVILFDPLRHYRPRTLALQPDPMGTAVLPQVDPPRPARSSPWDKAPDC